MTFGDINSVRWRFPQNHMSQRGCHAGWGVLYGELLTPPLDSG